MSDPRRLLPSAVDVPFPEIESALALAGQRSRKGRPELALTATVVVVGPRERLADAVSALEVIRETIGVRIILIADGTDPAPPVQVSHHAVALDGLRSDYLNNAVAALRLSSLPTLVWWRGGQSEALAGLAGLADRLVLDSNDPAPAWTLVAALAERTAISDLRWTRLTQWRGLMANLFDVPEVRAAVPLFRSLEIEGGDLHAVRLYGGWLMSSLQWAHQVAVDFRGTPSDMAIERVRFGSDADGITLRVADSRNCLEGTASVGGQPCVSRTIVFGDQSLGSLIAEELRIRSRDLPFERALRAAGGIV